MNKYIRKDLKYNATPGTFVFFPRFWAVFDGKTTQIYSGSLEGGGTYYELKGDWRKQIKTIVSLLGNKSARSLVEFAKINKANKIG